MGVIRTAAFLTAMMATLVAIEAATTGTLHLWDLVLAGSLLTIGIPAAYALWRTNGFESRLIAGVLALLTLIGQLLVAMVGGPGGAGGRWDPTSVLVTAVATGVLGLMAADAWASRFAAGRSHRDRAEPPYAL